MKKMIGRICIILASVLALTLLLGYVIDPFNVFHWNNIRDNGIEPNKNYIKTRYILANPEKYDGFILGSSRVGSIHTENIPDQQIYNMTYAMGTPQENLDTLKIFLENHVRIRTLYLGLDDISISEDTEKHNHQPIRASYSFLQNPIEFMKLYCDPAIIRQGLAAILSRTNSVGFESFYEYGWWCGYDIPVLQEWADGTSSKSKGIYLTDALDSIREIKKLCEENQIALTVFINPVSAYKYQYIDQDAFRIFLSELAQITDYYNFSGPNDITSSPSSYVDNGHCSAAVGDIILNRILTGKIDAHLLSQGFGAIVTAENSAELLAQIYDDGK